MAEVTSGTNLTVIVLDEEEAEQLQDLLNTHPTLMEDHPAIWSLDLGLGA
tara:strand:+ start:686 stop:835 length:150 start_codon:yes stop_codon:yes gene_type:complete